MCMRTSTGKEHLYLCLTLEAYTYSHMCTDGCALMSSQFPLNSYCYVTYCNK